MEQVSNIKYFDCGLNTSERNIVYDELTGENLRNWFKATKGKFPIRIMDEDDLRGYIRKDEDGNKLLVAHRWNWPDDVVTDEWTLCIGKAITNRRWFAIARFIEEYIDGTLQFYCGWNKNHRIRLA